MLDFSTIEPLFSSTVLNFGSPLVCGGCWEVTDGMRCRLGDNRDGTRLCRRGLLTSNRPSRGCSSPPYAKGLVSVDGVTSASVPVSWHLAINLANSPKFALRSPQGKIGCLPILAESRVIDLVKLPSSSPAYAAVAYAEKLRAWEALRKWLDE